jgi:hypothetical protein
MTGIHRQPVLIPGPFCTGDAQTLLGWTWDQSLMTVATNTITRVKAQLVQSSIRKTAYGSPRSIVTDHLLLDHWTWIQA